MSEVFQIDIDAILAAKAGKKARYVPRFLVSYLKKIFSKYAGLGIHKYFLKSKITIACRLLRRGMSVCDVSEKLSFSSHNYFSTVFKRETGRLPSDFRKEK